VILKRPNKLPNGSRLSPGLRNSEEPAPTRRLILAATGAVLLPGVAGAQSARRRRIAILAVEQRSFAPYLAAFREGLRALDYRDEDIEIEIRYSGEHAERLPELAVELVGLAPEVIVAAAGVPAAKQATATIPIVMAGAGDPVAAGFVASLARPGGNITGLSGVVSYEIVGKSLQLLKTAILGAKRIAYLSNPGNPQQASQLQVARQAAHALNIELLPVEARTPDEINGAFAVMTPQGADALVVGGDVVFNVEMSRVVGLAARHKLPAIYPGRDFAEAGGLMSYGSNLKDLWRRAATYVDKILKGAKPADLPVEQPTKFELVVNLKTAQALGLTIPQSILVGVDEVIE
jgi:putative ABC transport system substrate-binding protein